MRSPDVSWRRHPRGVWPSLFASAAALALLTHGCDDDEDDDGGGGACDPSATAGPSTSSAATTGATSSSGTGGEGGAPVIALKEAKLNIEHNATDLDTGFQGALDGEGWQRIEVVGPEGKVLSFEGHGRLHDLGLTELFFESVEPENADVPLDELLLSLPEGNYTFRGPTTDGMVTIGTALLTHDIPAGPALLTPLEDAVVPPLDVVMSWAPVTETITGGPVTIISYQLIVEKTEAPHPHMIGKRGLSMYLQPAVTSLTLPNEFLEPGTVYAWEVLAIEESGNQTLSSSTFTTE